jgi:hypothetical protein
MPNKDKTWVEPSTGTSAIATSQRKLILGSSNHTDNRTRHRHTSYKPPMHQDCKYNSITAFRNKFTWQKNLLPDIKPQDWAYKAPAVRSHMVVKPQSEWFPHKVWRKSRAGYMLTSRWYYDKWRYQTWNKLVQWHSKTPTKIGLPVAQTVFTCLPGEWKKEGISVKAIFQFTCNISC